MDKSWVYLLSEPAEIVYWVYGRREEDTQPLFAAIAQYVSGPDEGWCSVESIKAADGTMVVDDHKLKER